MYFVHKFIFHWQITIFRKSWYQTAECGMVFNKPLRTTVGADLSCPPPIYRPSPDTLDTLETVSHPDSNLYLHSSGGNTLTVEVRSGGVGLFDRPPSPYRIESQ